MRWVRIVYESAIRRGSDFYFGLDGVKPTLPGTAVSFILAEFCLIKRQSQLPPIRFERVRDSPALALEQLSHTAAFRLSTLGQSVFSLFK